MLAMDSLIGERHRRAGMRSALIELDGGPAARGAPVRCPTASRHAWRPHWDDRWDTRTVVTSACWTRLLERTGCKFNKKMRPLGRQCTVELVTSNQSWSEGVNNEGMLEPGGSSVCLSVCVVLTGESARRRGADW